MLVRLVSLFTLLFVFAVQAQSVQQSGNVTPGHITQWVTDGVISDGGPLGGNATLSGSFSAFDFLCANSLSNAPLIISCGLSASSPNTWNALQTFSGGAIVVTRSPGDNTTNAATTAFVNAAVAASTTIGGVTISGTPAVGYVPIATSSTTAVWGNQITGPFYFSNPIVPASFTTPAYAFTDTGVTGLSFPDANTHFSFTIAGNTPTSGTGSYEGFIINENGYGRLATGYVTGAQFNAIANSGAGNYTGSNPAVLILSGAAVQTAVGEEINVVINTGATTNYKEGLRIADLGAIDASGGGSLSAGIVQVKGASSPGFVYGLYFGDPTLGDSLFPIKSTGSLLKASTSAATIASGIDISGMAGFTSCAICLPSNSVGINFGAVGVANGGRVLSETAVNGPDVILANNFFAIQFGGTNTPLLAQSNGTVVIADLILTAAAPTVAAAQIGYGSTVTANTNCGTLAGSAGCVVINVAGTTRYVPYY